MAEILLPTQQVNLKDSISSRGVQNRFSAPTPNKDIAFSVDPNRNISMMKDAVEAITKHLEEVQKAEQDALVQQANNEYTLAVGESLDKFEDQKGENAVKGYDDFQKNVSELNDEYSKVFKNRQMQSDLNKLRQNATLNARLNGQNWKNKQVYEFGKEQRSASVQIAGDNVIKNLGTPNDANNFAVMQNAVDKVIEVDHGILDKTSDAYKVLKEKYYDNAFKDALGAQIELNPSMAKTNLERIRGLISDTLYAKYSGAIKKELKAQYNEYLRTKQLEDALKDAEKERREKFYNNELSLTDYETYKEEHRKALVADYVKDNKLSSEKDISKEALSEIDKEAENLAEKDRQAHNARYFRFHNTNASIASYISSDIEQALSDESFNIYSPLGSLSKEKKDILITRMGEDGAEKFVRQRAFELSTARNTADDFFMLTPDEQIKIYKDKQGLESYFRNNEISIAERWKVHQYMDKLFQQMKNGESVYIKPVLNARDEICQNLFKKNFRQITEPEEKRLVYKFMNKIQGKLNLEYQKTKDPTVFSDPDHILDVIQNEKLYSLPKMKQDMEDFNDTCDDVYNHFSTTTCGKDTLMWNPDKTKEEIKQLIKKKGVEFEKENGRVPTKNEWIDLMQTYANEAIADSDRFLGTQRWKDYVRKNYLNLPTKKPMQQTAEDYLYQGVTNPEQYDPLVESAYGNDLAWKLKILNVFASDLVF